MSTEAAPLSPKGPAKSAAAAWAQTEGQLLAVKDHGSSELADQLFGDAERPHLRTDSDDMLLPTDASAAGEGAGPGGRDVRVNVVFQRGHRDDDVPYRYPFVRSWTLAQHLEALCAALCGPSEDPAEYCLQLNDKAGTYLTHALLQDETFALKRNDTLRLVLQPYFVVQRLLTVMRRSQHTSKRLVRSLARLETVLKTSSLAGREFVKQRGVAVLGELLGRLWARADRRTVEDMDGNSSAGPESDSVGLSLSAETMAKLARSAGDGHDEGGGGGRDSLSQSHKVSSLTGALSSGGEGGPRPAAKKEGDSDDVGSLPMALVSTSESDSDDVGSASPVRRSILAASARATMQSSPLPERPTSPLLSQPSSSGTLPPSPLAASAKSVLARSPGNKGKRGLNDDDGSGRAKEGAGQGKRGLKLRMDRVQHGALSSSPSVYRGPKEDVLLRILRCVWKVVDDCRGRMAGTVWADLSGEVVAVVARTLFDCKRVEIRRLVLRLLGEMVHEPSIGFAGVDAGLRASHVRRAHAYAHVVDMLTEPELATAVRVVAFMNAMLRGAPDADTHGQVLAILDSNQWSVALRKAKSRVVSARTSLSPRAFGEIADEYLRELWSHMVIRLQCVSEAQKARCDSRQESTLRLLMMLWEGSLIGKEPFPGVEDIKWRRLGFTADNPCTAFNITGMLGLQQLAYFATRHREEAHEMMAMSNTGSFPLIDVSTTVTNMLCGDLLPAEESDYVDATVSVPYSLFLFAGPWVMDRMAELYVVGMRAFYHEWVEHQAKADDFPQMYVKARTKLAGVLKEDPVDLERLELIAELVIGEGRRAQPKHVDSKRLAKFFGREGVDGGGGSGLDGSGGGDDDAMMSPRTRSRRFSMDNVGNFFRRKSSSPSVSRRNRSDSGSTASDAGGADGGTGDAVLPPAFAAAGGLRPSPGTSRHVSGSGSVGSSPSSSSKRGSRRLSLLRLSSSSTTSSSSSKRSSELFDGPLSSSSKKSGKGKSLSKSKRGGDSDEELSPRSRLAQSMPVLPKGDKD